MVRWCINFRPRRHKSDQQNGVREGTVVGQEERTEVTGHEFCRKNELVSGGIKCTPLSEEFIGDPFGRDNDVVLVPDGEPKDWTVLIRPLFKQ